ncbi:MAG: FAD-dependent oxidoreductase [Bacteroidales bacterium]|nr:FAD-dependent oxidoreductase [Bacteroidales bacterium]
MNQFDTIILGAGPAGLTAGIYLSRAKRKVVIIDKGIPGGQMVLTHEVANYPGFENISGYMLSMNMKKQAELFGAKVISNAAIKAVNLVDDQKTVTLSNGEVYSAPSFIVATGGRSRQIGVNGESDFTGRGISYCATCDGDFFTGKEIIVVGGGNTALEEAVALTTYAKKVTIVHQFDKWQAFNSAIQEMEENPAIDSIMESRIVEFRGDEKLNEVVIEHIPTGSTYVKPIDGVFVFIGYVPNTEDFKGILELNQWGEIVVDSTFQTNLKGVYAAGDSIVKRYRQITTAVSDGTIASLNVAEFLNSIE